MKSSFLSCALVFVTLFVHISGLPTLDEDVLPDPEHLLSTNETENEAVERPESSESYPSAGPSLDERISHLERITNELVEAVGPQANGTDVIAYQIKQIVALNEKRKESGQAMATHLDQILTQVSILQSKLRELESNLRSLIGGVRSTSETSEYAPPEPVSGSRSFGTSRATFYRSTGQSGREESLDFGSCRTGENCCLNLMSLNDDTESINTFGTCVEVFLDSACRGDSRQYSPGAFSQDNFGEFKNRITSARPC